MESIGNFNREWGPGSVLIHTEKVRSVDMLRARGAEEAHELARWLAHAPHGIVNLDGRGMLVVSVARRLGSEGPLLAIVLTALTKRGRKKALWVR